MGIHSEPKLYRKLVAFLKLLNIYLNHFPRHEKYALANDIRSTAYAVFDLVTEGEKRYLKKTTLTNLDIAHEKLRMQLYLAYELGYFRFKDGKQADEHFLEREQNRYQAITQVNDEIGKMIGGWIKKIKDDNRWN
jgi:four helix bundle protein